MPEIDQLIKESINPFEHLTVSNIWEKSKLTDVPSIHQPALDEIKNNLALVQQEHKSRMIILRGDPGVGKTHFLRRLKETLNQEAFFVNIEPFPASESIWRHILRYTVEGLVNKMPEQQDSQLILWLKSCLSTLEKELQGEQQSLISKIKSFFGQNKTIEGNERQAFINTLKQTIGTQGIHNANEFFGILYALTNPNLYSLACEWLKCDNLDEENLKRLQVKQSIDNETDAKGILGNFSKISSLTQPIVLCFDQLDNIARLPDGNIDLQSLFSVNSAIHSGGWSGFLIIISINNSTLRTNGKRIQTSDVSGNRISSKVILEHISLEQGEELWKTRLYPLHNEADPTPDSPIFPLTKQLLEDSFPGGQAITRNVLMLGREKYQEYKQTTGTISPPPDDILIKLKLIWLDEFQKIQQKVTHLHHFATSELIQMLQEVLSALQVQGVKTRLLASSVYATHSLSYGLNQRIGLVWADETSMITFYNVMQACQKSLHNNHCQTLYLIRSRPLGKPTSKGYQSYQSIFVNSSNKHIKPDLNSIHYLATYHKLVNDACAKELVIGKSRPNHQELEELMRKSEIFKNCALLQQILGNKIPPSPPPDNKVKEFLVNLLETQLFLGQHVLIKNAIDKFPEITELQVRQIIQELCQNQLIQVIDNQLVCWRPKEMTAIPLTNSISK